MADVSRAGYYRGLHETPPRIEETGLRDAMQKIALARRRHGYRRITAELRRNGWCVSHKRVLTSNCPNSEDSHRLKMSKNLIIRTP